jgi:CRISPR-associated protein Cas5h
MNCKEVLIFDISSEYGHFRKYNTTTSPLTYSIPPRPAIAGILGAILGIEREIDVGKYPQGVVPVNKLFSKENSDIAVQIINPVKKVNVGINLINTGSKESFYNLTKAGRTQINFELLKDAKFRIYVAIEDNEIFSELEKRLKNKQHHFTPYLGLAQFTATIEFVDKKELQLQQNDNQVYIDVVTAVNLSQIQADNPVDFDYSAMYSANNMPVEMDEKREVQEYSEILTENNGKPIRAKVEKYYKIENYGNIVFL